MYKSSYAVCAKRSTLPSNATVEQLLYLDIAMPVRRAISQPDGVFFITLTCTRWVPLFKLINGYDIVYNWFDYLKNEGHYVVGYVIMPNHLHAVIAFRNTGKCINTIISNGKRFMAYAIVSRLEKQQQKAVAAILKDERNATEVKEGKLHKVFETSFAWKECRTERFILQKLNYIHSNPCKAGLVAEPEDYEHSSGKFYIIGQHGIYKVTSYSELHDVDLTAGL